MESSDEEEKKEATTPAPSRKKKSVAQKVAEREELNRKAAEQKVRIVILSKFCCRTIELCLRENISSFLVFDWLNFVNVIIQNSLSISEW